MADGTLVEAIVAKSAVPLTLNHEGRDRLLTPPNWVEKDSKPHPDPVALVVHTLSGIAPYLSANRDQFALAELMLHVQDEEQVLLRGKLEPFGHFQRPCYLHAEWKSIFGDPFDFGEYYDAERFMIQLQTHFVPTDTVKQLLTLVAGIKDSKVTTTFDDGVAQEVQVAAGVTIVGNQKVPNPVALKPYRTFREVAQPESLFVLRLMSGREDDGKPKIALFEADGGQWRLEAIANIAAYLQERVVGVTVIA